jgi:quinoprotein glucose dehydrogenase
VWDFDLPCAPVLLDITVNGRRIKALAQVSKQAFTYVFDRTNGQPVWPIEERPVPQSDVPGEKTAATQPFPTKPAPFDIQGSRVEDLIDFTPELKAEAIKSMANVKMGPLYTPPIVKGAGGKEGMMQQLGGANWQGASGDPETGILYVPSVTSPYLSSLIADPSKSEMPYIAGGALGAMPRPFGLPPFKPPYGRITAIDLNTGDHLWMIPNGQTPEAVKNNPALRGIDTSNFGGGERTPILVTKTMLWSGGATFRALDKKTGAVLHEIKLPNNSTGGPMTYMLNGRQYIVVATGGRDGSELVALTLPQTGPAPRATQQEQ